MQLLYSLHKALMQLLFDSISDWSGPSAIMTINFVNSKQAGIFCSEGSVENYEQFNQKSSMIWCNTILQSTSWMGRSSVNGFCWRCSYILTEDDWIWSYTHIFCCQQNLMLTITGTKLSREVGQVLLKWGHPLLIISHQSLSQNVTTSIRRPTTTFFLPGHRAKDNSSPLLPNTSRCDQTCPPFKACSRSTLRGV